ncbi:MAG: MFS transporter [Chthonomonadales bacterium]|nr:MFS transporter [Chthonomonadales bacterium]
MAEVADSTASTQRWYQGVPRYAWLVLAIAALGWLFDTFDQHLFTLVRVTSVRELLAPHFTSPAALDAAVKEVGGQLTAVFLLGWAAGGFVFGVLGDRMGRTRTMVITILIYAVFTGLNGLVQEVWQYGACRFLVAMGVGGEFAAGASLVAEVWPNRSRPMALGLLQALSAVGNMAAAVVVLVLSGLSWRWVFAVGAIPALLVVWIRRSVREPERWVRAREEAATDGGRREVGNILALFAEPGLRRNTIAGVLLGTAGVGGAWGVGFFTPDLVTGALRPLVAHSAAVMALAPAEREAAIVKALQQYRSVMFFVQMLGAAVGMMGYAWLSERIGRRPAMLAVFICAFASAEATFALLREPGTAYLLAFQLGVFTLAPFAAYAVYFPELFPTRLRSTGVGFCYNAARVLAAFAPFALGTLSSRYASPTDATAGLRTAASMVACVYFVGVLGLLIAPETRGRPLPE